MTISFSRSPQLSVFDTRDCDQSSLHLAISAGQGQDELSAMKGVRVRQDSLTRQFLDDSRQIGQIQTQETNVPLRLLILDDDHAVADSLAVILRSAGFHAFAFYTDEDAIASARLVRYDIVLADVRLGSKSGIEAALRIRTIQPSCRILLLSGDEDAAKKVLTSKSDVDEIGVVAKPVQCSELISLLKNPDSTPSVGKLATTAVNSLKQLAS